MFSKKKSEPKKRRNHDLSQFGLMEIPDDFDPSKGFDDDDDIDSDLEAELAAITSGSEKKLRPAPPKPQKPSVDLDKMVAESMRDISDEDDDDADENDPDLLGELTELTGEPLDVLVPETSNKMEEEPPQIFLPTSTNNVVEIIKQRIQMYKMAEQNAKSLNEGGRARRFNRGVKTLEDLLKQANGGKNINVDDIPPEVSVKPNLKNDDSELSESPVLPTSPEKEKDAKPTTPENRGVSTPISPVEQPQETKPINPKLVAVYSRLKEYKVAALEAKRAGDTASALQFVKVIKQFDAVIKMVEGGQEVDLSDMPPPPEKLKEFLEQMQNTSNEPVRLPEQPAESVTEISLAEPQPPAESAKTLLEGLEQRLLKYQYVEEMAKKENNSSKSRRFGRIVKQYEDAIKACKRGKQIDIDELPCPPGYPPLPISTSSPLTGTPAAGTPLPVTPKPTPKASPDNVSPTSSESKLPTSSSIPNKTPPKPELTTRVSGNQKSTNLAERQMQILLERQKEFKQAAIEAKKAGEIEQAKEYLKIYKGFEGVLNAASNGLPVDLNSLPIPPSQRGNLENTFAIINNEDVDDNLNMDNDDAADISIRLEEQLVKQLMMCKNTRDHFRALGDVASMNRFENLALTVQKDLDLIRYSRKKNFSIPKFKYEKRVFNIVRSNADLTDNELEIQVIRGISYNVPNPKDIDTYVKIEFPYPQDNFFYGKTNLIKNTDSPDYDQKYIVEIQRSNRQCQRLFKRQAAKFEIYSRGCCLGGICQKFPMCCFSGFLRSDVLIGTVNVKLQQLETQCEIHDSFDLMDGRKQVGGKLEVKIRLRNPIVTKQMEKLNEKWLSFEV